MSAGATLLLLLQSASAPIDTSAWLTLPEAKAHLFVDFADDDAFIQQCIDTAAAHIENTTDYVPSDSVKTLTFASFAPLMRLDKAPIRAVQSVEYLDSEGELQTVPEADYRLGFPHGRATLMLGINKSWPQAAHYPDAVRVNVVCGPESRTDLPAPIRHAGKLLVGHWYKHREAVTLGAVSAELGAGVAALLAPYRQAWLA